MKAVDPPDITMPNASLVQTLVLSRAQAVTSAMVEIRDDMRLETAEDVQAAAELVKEVKRWHNEIDAERKSLTQPMDRIQKWINDLFRPVLSSLAAKEVRLKGMIANFHRQEQERQRQLLMAAAAQAQQAKTPQEYKAVVNHAVATVASAAAVPKNITVAEVWTFEVLDEAEVPVEYLSVDSNKVNAAIKAGLRDIPGIRVFSESRVTVRQK